MSPNGRMLASIIENHALTVANGSSKFSGLITRRRTMKHRNEKSCIDFVLFSSDLNNDFKSLIIDDERKHVLTKIKMTKHGVVKKESDHNVLIAEFTNTVPDKKCKKKIEIYNLKNAQCQRKFKEYTSNT